MQESKPVKITTPAQFSKLVEIMEKKPYLARGYNKGLNKINIKDEWNVIADDLNSIGPPSRTGEGWLKVWADFKFKLKKKLAHNKTESRATGGGSFKQYSLSPVEELAVNLLGMHTIVQHKDPFGLKRPLCDAYSVNVIDTSLLDENDETCKSAKRSNKATDVTGDKNTDIIFNETNDQPSTSKICSKNKTHEEMGNLKKSKKKYRK